MSNGTVQGSYLAVPVDAVALGGNYSLRPNGDLFFGNAIVLRNVARAAASMRAGAAGHFANAVLVGGGSVTLQGAQEVDRRASTGAAARPTVPPSSSRGLLRPMSSTRVRARARTPQRTSC